MNRDPFDNNEYLPPWLRDVPLPPRPAGAGDRPGEERSASRADASAGGPPAQAETNALPDWLKDLGAGSAPQQELPPWLRDETDEPAARPTDNADLPSWLRDMSGDAPADQADLPDWLQGPSTAPAGGPPGGAGDLEQRPHDLPPAAEPPTDAAPPSGMIGETTGDRPAGPAPSEAENMPAWLRDPPGETPAAGASELPAWLSDRSTAGAPSAPDLNADLAEPESPPPVTAGPSATDMPPSPPAPAEPPVVDEADIPSWLRDIPSDEIRRVMEGEEEGITAEPFSFESLPETPQSESGTGLPAWLANISDNETSGPSAAPSWLAGTPAEPPGAESTAPTEDNLPPWLQNLGDQPQPGEPEPPPQPQPPQTEAPLPNEGGEIGPSPGLPAWLQEVEQSQPPFADLPADRLSSLHDKPGEAPQPPENVPAWLRADVPTEPPAEDIPAWLRADLPAAPPDIPPAAPAAEGPPPRPSAPIPPGPADEELPAWLRDEPVAPPTDATLPEWLRSRGPASPAEPPQAESRPEVRPPRADDDLPPWLRDEGGQPLPTAGAPGDTNLPEWLRGARIEPAPPSSVTPQAPRQAGPPRLDWFDEPAPADAQERAPGESEFFGGAELPVWLRTPETEPAQEINPADARSLDWLTRLGTLEEESTVAAPTPKLRPPSLPTRSRAQLEALSLLQRLAAEPFPQAAPTPAPASASIWRRIGAERVLYLLLLVLLLAALAVPSLTADLQAPPEAPGARDLFQTIDALSENDTVLVGYEWDARRISELRPLKEAVIDQLIQKKVKLVLVSTDPQGTLLLYDLRDDLVRANYRTGGEDYILLGYKPGGELALRSFAQDFRGALRSDFQGNDASQGSLASNVATGQPRLSTLNDFSMILVLADDSSDVQGWMEQVHRSASQVPLAFLLPSETAPIVQPYLKQPRIYHLAGRQGALAYQQLSSPGGATTARIGREAGQQRLAILVFSALLVIGAIGVGAAGAANRRRKAS